MTTLVNLYKGINWSSINVKTTKKEGTLGTLNVAVLPKKSECSEQAWKALGALETAWKAFVRRSQYISDYKKHTTIMNNAIDNFRRYSDISYPTELFRDLVISALNVHYCKKDDSYKSVAMITFKKAVIRMSIRIQSGNFSLNNNVKGDTQKVNAKTFNIKDLSKEQICDLLGIDLATWERVVNAKAC